ncbi:glutathione transferase GstA [Aquabacterium sp. J223]|uniref:glutathione transferase GstA n=1 Tax=Aquabacterium sp. J223 TaxID=2898431 RepID=UPI0021AE21B6|nr:glutathione transferase GstA [Aquabacterium sp. J223]UUX96215.1 glutathione transferase GstA [Aquabacterium sp. J223]
MKLYHAPGACSLSPHIVLREAGLPFDLKLVAMKTKTLADGTDYTTINPKGYVPLLELDGGERLTEGPAIVQWIADQVPDKQLAPPPGTLARYRLMEWLNFITAELHKGFSPLFNPAVPAEVKAVFQAKLLERLAWVDGELAGQRFLLGDTFTVADAYLFVVAGWTRPTKIDVSHLAHLGGFMTRVAERPAVQAALKAEGLLPH